MDLIDVYCEAKRLVLKKGYIAEIEWQRLQEFGTFTESDLLREAAWVILCSGFKESIIREKFSYISLCFCDWESAREILINRDICLLTTLDTFGHRQKINAILKLAEIIELEGFERLKAKILKSPLKQLQIIPFIGEITTWHLAKNLGLSVAKPDRHLVRLANFLGYTDVQRLCRDVADIADEPVNVVDIVFWRYCTFTPTRAFV